MTKTHTIETIEEYDSNGKLTRKTVTETTEENNDPAPTYWSQWGPTCTGSPINPSRIATHHNVPSDTITVTTTNGCDHVCDCGKC